MPSATDPIVTPQELQKYLTGDNDLYVQIASGVVRAYCHWHIWPQVTTEVHMMGKGNMTQPLPTLRAVAISDLMVDNEPWDESKYELVPHPNNLIRARRGYHDLGGYLDYSDSMSDEWRWGYNRFPKGRRISCQLTHGYAELPDALKGLVLNIAARAQGMPASWLRSLQTEDYRYEFVSRTSTDSIGGFQLTNDDKNQLAAFWIPGIA